jgi:hypothetical protein
MEVADLDSLILSERTETSDTGGLLNALAMTKIETMEVTRAMLLYAHYARKYGLPTAFSPGGSKPNGPPGKPVEDEDAL